MGCMKWIQNRKTTVPEDPIQDKLLECHDPVASRVVDKCVRIQGGGVHNSTNTLYITAAY